MVWCIKDEADHDLTGVIAGADINMADKPCPVFFIIRRNVVIVHPRKHDFQDLTHDRSLNRAVRHWDNAVRMPGIKSCHRVWFSIFIQLLAYRELGFVAVMPWGFLLHPEDWEPLHGGKIHAADASKTIFYFVLFVPKLCIVR